jgi:hypothetical protein
MGNEENFTYVCSMMTSSTWARHSAPARAITSRRSRESSNARLNSNPPDIICSRVVRPQIARCTKSVAKRQVLSGI